MGITHIERSFKDIADRILGEEGVAQVCSEYLRRMKNGLFEDEYADALYQKFERHGSPTIYDALGFGQLHGEILCGNIVHAEIALGEEPSSDENIEGNNRKLQKLSRIRDCSCHAEFHGGNQGADGHIYFAEPIRFARTRLNSSEKQITDIVEEKLPSLPLEVGTVSVAKMLWYFRCTDGVARWPYRSEKIFLFHNRLGQRQVIPE